MHLPAILDVALTGGLWAAGLAGFIEGIALARSNGIPLDQLLAGASRMVTLLDREIKRAGQEIGADDFSTDQATVSVWRDGVRKYRSITQAQGQPAHLLNGLMASLDDAIAKGWGESSFSAQYASARRESASASG